MYLLRETAEELVQELREDKAYILRDGERRKVHVSADFVGITSTPAVHLASRPQLRRAVVQPLETLTLGKKCSTL